MGIYAKICRLNLILIPIRPTSTIQSKYFLTLLCPERLCVPPIFLPSGYRELSPRG